MSSYTRNDKKKKLRVNKRDTIKDKGKNRGGAPPQ